MDFDIVRYVSIFLTCFGHNLGTILVPSPAIFPVNKFFKQFDHRPFSVPIWRGPRGDGFGDGTGSRRY